MGDEVKPDEVVTNPPPAEEKTVKRVMLDQKKLRDNLVTTAEKEIELPQLNKLMGLDNGEIAVVKIRQLDLDEYLSCQQANEDRLRNLMDGIIAAAEKRGEIEDEVLAAFKGLSEKSKYYIDLCLKGVVEPILKRADWIFLARRFPLVVEEIAANIILLTRGGANLKKNS